MANLNKHDVTSFPDPLDILAGPTDAEKIVTDLATIRKNISVDDLGNLAGSAVLDQYKAASAVITKKPINLNAVLASDVPRAAAIIAAIALDIGIMGGAAAGLIAKNIWLWPIGVGTLVYGVAMGETHADGSKIKHGVIVGATGVACLLAAVSLSNDKAYIANSSTLLPSSWNTQSYDSTATVKTAQAKLATDTEERDRVHDLIYGNPSKGVKDILDDGVKNNDFEMPQLQAQLPDLQKQVVTDEAAISQAQKAVTVAEDSNPATRLARYIAAVTFLAPLFVSLTYVGHVIGRAPARQKAKAAADERLKQYKEFVRGLEMPTSMRAKATQEATKMLQRFNSILTVAAKDDPEKLAKVEALFTGEPYMESLEIAVDLICGSLTSESEWKATAPGLHARTAEWRKAKHGIDSENTDAPPASKPDGDSSPAPEAEPAATEAPAHNPESDNSPKPANDEAVREPLAAKATAEAAPEATAETAAAGSTAAPEDAAPSKPATEEAVHEPVAAEGSTTKPEDAAVQQPAANETVREPVVDSEIFFMPDESQKAPSPAEENIVFNGTAPKSATAGPTNGGGTNGSPTGNDATEAGAGGEPGTGNGAADNGAADKDAAGQGPGKAGRDAGPTRPTGQVIVTFGEDGKIGIENRLKHGPGDASQPAP